jgi:hypothetical protein
MPPQESTLDKAFRYVQEAEENVQMQRAILEDFRSLELDTLWPKHLLAQFETRLSEKRLHLARVWTAWQFPAQGSPTPSGQDGLH